MTACALALPRAPASTQLAFLACDSFDGVLDTFAAASRDLAEVLSAVEFLDAESFGLVTAHGAVDPLGAEGGGAAHYMLVELSGSNAEHDAAKLETFLGHVMESGSVSNGAIAQDGAQMAAMWRIREGITEALSRTGAVYKYDVSVRPAELCAPPTSPPLRACAGLPPPFLP